MNLKKLLTRFLPKPKEVKVETKQPVIVDEKRKMSLTRQDVTLAVASANIGEINPKLTGAFEDLLRKESRGWVTDSAAVPLDMIEIEYASLRQIAFELLNSLEDQLK